MTFDRTFIMSNQLPAATAPLLGKNTIDYTLKSHTNALKSLVKDLEKDEANSFPFLEPVQYEGEFYYIPP